MPKNTQTANLLLSFQQDVETLLSASPTMILVFQLDGKIVVANDAAARSLERPFDSVIGNNVFALIKPADVPFETRVLEVAESRDVLTFEMNNQGRTLSCFMYPIPNERGSVVRVALLGQDITERQRAEEQVRVLTQELERKVVERTAELQKANQKLLQEKQRAELLADFSSILVEFAYDYNSLVQHISDEIARLIGDICIVGIYSDDQAELRAAAVSHRDPAVSKKMRAALMTGTYSIAQSGIRDLVQKKEAYISGELTSDQARQMVPAEYRRFIGAEGPKGLACIPLLARERILGGIIVIRDNPGSLPYAQEEISFLQSITSPLALTIENAQLFEEIKENRQQLSGLSRQLVEIQEDQFQRLGRELHDHVGQDLTAINLNLSLLEGMLPENSPDGIHQRLEDTGRLVELAVGRMRNIMADFRPPMLDTYGLAPALFWYCQQLTQRTELPVNVNDRQMSEVRLPLQAEVGLFRIAQEALANIVKHARAKRVDIDLVDEDGIFTMTVADDGVGFDPREVASRPEAHWGLAIMRERARAIDAFFALETAPGKGTKVVLNLARKA
jgi:PAS domain S-box-containing protein